MCCEAIAVHPKKGFLGGLKTTLSAVYVTSKWLVWADSSGRNIEKSCKIMLLNQGGFRGFTPP
jgi:hypothetical protein